MDSVNIEAADIGGKKADMPSRGSHRALVFRLREIARRTVREPRTRVRVVLKGGIYFGDLDRQPMLARFLTGLPESNIDSYTTCR